MNALQTIHKAPSISYHMLNNNFCNEDLKIKKGKNENKQMNGSPI